MTKIGCVYHHKRIHLSYVIPGRILWQFLSALRKNFLADHFFEFLCFLIPYRQIWGLLTCVWFNSRRNPVKKSIMIQVNDKQMTHYSSFFFLLQGKTLIVLLFLYLSSSVFFKALPSIMFQSKCTRRQYVS